MKVRKIHSCLDPRGPLVLHLMDPFVFFALSSIGQPNVFDRVLKVWNGFYTWFSPKLWFCYEVKFKRKTKHCVFCTGTINSEKTKPATPGICIVQAQPFYPINQPGISLNLFTDNKSQKLILLFNFVNTSSNVHLP